MNTAPTHRVFAGLFVLLLLGISAFGAYNYYLLSEEYAETKKSLIFTIREFNDKVTALTEKNRLLVAELTSERDKNAFFAAQISGIASTVGTLEKLSKTDRELLQKYSKIYFLNEHYVPSNLTDINSKYLYPEDKPQQIHTSVLPYLTRLMESASSDGVDLKILSAYRSFSAQASLKSAYKITYGAGTANQFSADQGYSEHQLGTALDFTNSQIGSTLSKFKTTPAYEWLSKNAHVHGFVLSYPENNEYYFFEPWHWRFAGVALATKLHDEKKYFYDLDQREIDQNLVNIFD